MSQRSCSVKAKSLNAKAAFKKTVPLALAFLWIEIILLWIVSAWDRAETIVKFGVVIFLLLWGGFNITDMARKRLCRNNLHRWVLLYCLLLSVTPFLIVYLDRLPAWAGCTVRVVSAVFVLILFLIDSPDYVESRD